MNTPRIDFVVPRYGVMGGAENAVRVAAEQVAARLGWTVHLHATTATSSVDWANAAPEGTAEINGITVHRSRVDSGRTAEWPPLNDRVKASPTTVDPVTEGHFFRSQGPVSSALAEQVAASDADLIVFAPYLFWTSVEVAKSVMDRAVVVPAAHDEPFLRLPGVRGLLTGARGLLYGCAAERQLLESVMPVAHLPNTVLGWGIDPDAASFAHGGAGVDEPALPPPLDDGRPFVLCLGRIEHAKGSVVLADFWHTYAERRRPSHRLVLAGQRNADIATSDDVVVVDDVPEALKWALLRGADVMVTPSAMESFSLVVLESWAAGTPVVVNAHCGATMEHVRLGQGGLAYRDYPHFEAVMDRLLADPTLRDELGARGARYGAERFSWDAITRRFASFCERLL